MSQSDHLESEPAGEVEDEELPDDPVGEAKAAVTVGLWVSAFRCIITYVVAPVLGTFGLFVLGPIATLLQILGAIVSTFGARRLYKLKHRMWIGYAVLALLVWALAIYSVLTIGQKN